MRNLRHTLLSCSALVLCATGAQAQISEAEVKASEKAAAKTPAPTSSTEAPTEKGASTEESALEGSAEAEAAEDASPAEGEAAEASVKEEASAKPETKAATTAAATTAEEDAEVQADTAQLLAESKALEKKRKQEAGEDEPPLEDPDPNTLPFTYHVNHLDLQAGVTMIRAGSDGLEPYRNKPFLAQGFARFGGTVYATDRIGVSLTGGLAGGSYNSSVREQSSHLGLFELNAGAELRYHFHHRLYAYGRLSGGPELATTQIGGDYDDDALEANSWAFRGDGTVGAAVRLFGNSDGQVRGPRLWFFGDIGYRLATQHKQEMQVVDGGPARPEEVDMENFSTSGLTGSLGLSLTY